MGTRIILLVQLHIVIPSTHWLVTETGKIEAQPDSIFFMKQPNDLVSFLHQEQRYADMNSLHDKLASFRGKLDDNKSLEVPDLEGLLSKEDPDCVFAGRSLTQFDLYISTLVPFTAMNKLEILSINSQTKLKEPWCSKKELMNLNLEKIDGLKGIIDRKELIMQEETGIMSLLLEDGRIRLSQYGHSVSKVLKKEKTSWTSYNLASLYWRMKGDPFESIECLRRALHFGVNRESQSVSLVHLGNVLHQSLRSEDAATVLEMAVDSDPLSPVAHYTVGNVYAVLMMYNKSVQSFDHAISLSQDLDWVKRRRAAVLCHRKLEMALESQHSKLQRTLEELKTYQSEHSHWSKMNSKLNTVQASLETRVSSRDSYEHFKLLTEGKRFRPQGCYENIAGGRKVLECVAITYDSDHTPHHSIFRRNTPTSEAEVPDDVVESFTKIHQYSSDDDGPWAKPNNAEGDKKSPTKKKKYPKLGSYNEFKSYENPQWPSKDECVSHVTRFPEWANLPTVYLSPENKGFEIQKIINQEISLDPLTPHPLPWFPPHCDAEKSENIKLQKRYVDLPGFKSQPSKEKYPDDSIRGKFLFSFGKYDGQENIAELGARIKTASETSSWPGWLLDLLAANYWRIIGNSGASLTCYRLALHSTPLQYKDLVLTNLGALLYRLGHVDSALKLLQESVAVCDTEPETHFFLANLLSAKGNMTGAIHHYRAALRLEPDYPGGVDLLRIPSCYLKYHLSGGEVSQPPSKPSHCSRGNSLTNIQKCQPRAQCCKPVRQAGCDESCSQQRSCSCNSCNLPAQPQHSYEGTTDFILCRDGHCQFVTKEDVKLLELEEKGKKKVEESCPSKEKVVRKEKEEPPAPPAQTSPVEIATIAVTDDSQVPLGLNAVVRVPDDPLPDVLVKPKPNLQSFKYPVSSASKCAALMKKKKSFTSTWLSVSAKNINFADHLPASHLVLTEKWNPVCQVTPPSLRSLDHLSGLARRKSLQYQAELGLKEAFQSLAGKKEEANKESVEKVGARIAYGLAKNPKSWILSTAAALYWRVQGNAVEALNCIRHSLYYAPNDMRDIPLISLANVMHRSGLYNDAIIAANMALEISPSFVVSHFTLANIYTSKKDLEKAKLFYVSTLTLQTTFEPALERLTALLCGQKFF